MLTNLKDQANESLRSMMNGQDLVTWLILLTVGASISAVGVAALLVPAQVAGPGVLGVATILNHLWEAPIGLVTLLANIPIQILGYRYLGGMKTVVGTIYYVVVFSIFVDVLAPILASGLTDNLLIAAIFGGVLNGLGGGLVYKADGTMGGTSTLARILQMKLGAPLSTTCLYTDILVTIAAGMVFGWNGALAAIITLYLTGVASDYILEGPSIIYTAMIVTDHTDTMEIAIEHSLNRASTRWNSEASLKHRAHGVLFVTVARPEARQLTETVTSVDPGAFVTMSLGQAAYGPGFTTKKFKPPT